MKEIKLFPRLPYTYRDQFSPNVNKVQQTHDIYNFSPSTPCNGVLTLQLYLLSEIKILPHGPWALALWDKMFDI